MQRTTTTTPSNTLTTTTTISTTTNTPDPNGIGAASVSSRPRTLGFGFGVPQDDAESGRVATAFTTCLGFQGVFAHAELTSAIGKLVSSIPFSEHTEIAWFDGLVANVKSSFDDDGWSNQFKLLKEALSDRQGGPYAVQAAALESLVSLIHEISQLLLQNHSVRHLRAMAGQVLGDLDKSLWPEQMSEPALTGSGNKSKAKKDKGNSSKSKSLGKALKRLSMKFSQSAASQGGNSSKKTDRGRETGHDSHDEWDD